MTIYPIITIQVPRTYFLYALAVINLLMCVLILILTPESKGKSIIELEMLFQENTVFCYKKSSSKTTQEQIEWNELVYIYQLFSVSYPLIILPEYYSLLYYLFVVC